MKEWSKEETLHCNYTIYGSETSIFDVFLVPFHIKQHIKGCVFGIN